MSLTIPILLPTVSFDATKNKIFTFTAQISGKQIVSNKLTITDQTTDMVVYDKTISSFKYEHLLPANSITNGQSYKASITIIASDGTSAQSRPIEFSCISTPIIGIQNLPSEGESINTNVYVFQMFYTQAERVPINSYEFNLYNFSKVLISTSNVKYVSADYGETGEPPYQASYPFYGFEDGATYYIEVVVETKGGMVVSTGLNKFLVDYIRPSYFSLVNLENKCEEGCISVSSNVQLIEGESDPFPPNFIDGREIDLSGEYDYVAWNKGYLVDGDFAVRGWFRRPGKWNPIGQYDDTRLLELGNIKGGNLVLEYREGYKNIQAQKKQSYLILKTGDYYIYSNYVDIPYDPDKVPPPSEYNTTKYVFHIKRVNGIYQLQLDLA